MRREHQVTKDEPSALRAPEGKSSGTLVRTATASTTSKSSVMTFCRTVNASMAPTRICVTAHDSVVRHVSQRAHQTLNTRRTQRESVCEWRREGATQYPLIGVREKWRQ